MVNTSQPSKCITDAIRYIQNNIETEKAQIKILEMMDIPDVPSEDDWHMICDTPLRMSQVMASFVRSIFPDAEDIVISEHYASFKLNGFNVQIPTTKERGIHVDLSWYEPKEPMPEMQWSRQELRIMQFFQAEDDGLSWKDKAKAIAHGTAGEHHPYREWFLRNRWHLPDEEDWREILEKKQERFDELCAEIRKKNERIDKKVNDLLDILLPKINIFSEIHGNYNGTPKWDTVTIEEIIANKNAEETKALFEEWPEATKPETGNEASGEDIPLPGITADIATEQEESEERGTEQESENVIPDNMPSDEQNSTEDADDSSDAPEEQVGNE